jgi:DNA-binding transcriptional MocR family regulator
VMNLATATAPQLAVAELLERGGYDRYLRQARREYATAVARMIDAVEKYFPEGTRITQPQGGFVIWIEFPEGVDAELLYAQALAHGISIAPGTIFSAARKYRNFIRLNCAVPWDARVERAIARLGQLALAML